MDIWWKWIQQEWAMRKVFQETSWTHMQRIIWMTERSCEIISDVYKPWYLPWSYILNFPKYTLYKTLTLIHYHLRAFSNHRCNFNGGFLLPELITSLIIQMCSMQIRGTLIKLKGTVNSWTLQGTSAQNFKHFQLWLSVSSKDNGYVHLSLN